MCGHRPQPQYALLKISALILIANEIITIPRPFEHTCERTFLRRPVVPGSRFYRAWPNSAARRYPSVTSQHQLGIQRMQHYYDEKFDLLLIDCLVPSLEL